MPETTTKPSTFGPWLRDRRRAPGVSLRLLAERAGVSFSYLSKVETGHLPPPSPEKLAVLGAQLGIGPSAMYLEAGIVPPHVKDAFKRGVSLETYSAVLKLLEAAHV